MDYNPKPIETGEMELSQELLAMTEKLAENAHNIGAQGRMKEGWTYGEKRDGVLKKHPNLLPYDQLPESEKEYDRRTAMETLKAVLALGYRITLAEVRV